MHISCKLRLRGRMRKRAEESVRASFSLLASVLVMGGWSIAEVTSCKD